MLVAFGVTVLALGGVPGPALRSAAWCRRMPRAAAWVWLGVLAATLAAAVGMVVIVFAGRRGLGHRVVEWLANCWYHHERAGGSAWYVISTVLIVAAATTTWVAVARFRRTVRQRRRHREALGYVVRLPGEPGDVCILDHPLPVVYCLPARERPIVVSSGALESLDERQLAAVLAHERSHLRHRDHLVLGLLDALAAALAWLPTFRQARACLPPLLEMSADDVAARRYGHATVASALRRLAIVPCPTGGLAAAAADHSALHQRLARLELAPISPEPRIRRLTWAAAMTSMTVPVFICAAWLSAIPLFC